MYFDIALFWLRGNLTRL